MADEQQPDRPPGMPCPECMFYIDCDMATALIQAENFKCPNCYFDLSSLTDYFKDMCPSASNQ